MSNAHTSTLSVNSTKIRDPYFDNARGLLITLVVAGHALLEIGGVYSRYLADFFYTFHMPAFILIAGYFSRSYAATPAQNRRLISGIAAPYLIFFVLHEVFSTFKRGSFVFPDFSHRGGRCGSSWRFLYGDYSFPCSGNCGSLWLSLSPLGFSPPSLTL